MKITFFKDESYFYPRTSYFWKNAELVKFNKINGKILNILNWVFIISIGCYVSVSRLLFDQKNIVGFIFIPLALLPLHEFCHVLYALIIKKKVIGIRFFPYNYGFTWSKASAYIKLDFCAMKKAEAILLATFPFIIMTFLPLFLIIFFPSIRIILIYSAIINTGASVSDLCNAIHFLRAPRDAIYFHDCCWLIPTSDQPISIHRMRKIKDEDKLLHEQWLYADYQLTKVDEPEIDESVELFVNDFQKQFGANCHI